MQTLKLQDGSMLTPKPIHAQNVKWWCEQYLKTNSLQNYSFELCNEQGEFIRHIRYIGGIRQPIEKKSGGRRTGAGRPRIYQRTKIEKLTSE